jgi:hypothetical protein
VKIRKERFSCWISTTFWKSVQNYKCGLTEDAKLTVKLTGEKTLVLVQSLQWIVLVGSNTGQGRNCSSTRHGLETEITFRWVASHSWALHVSLRDSSFGVATPTLHGTTLNHLNQYTHDFFLLSEFFLFFNTKKVSLLISWWQQK